MMDFPEEPNQYPPRMTARGHVPPQLKAPDLIETQADRRSSGDFIIGHPFTIKANDRRKAHRDGPRPK